MCQLIKYRVGFVRKFISMSQGNSARPIKVLLVEDYLLTRTGLKAIIDRDPEIAIIGEAQNGEEAIAKVSELLPDVILMDVGMPVMDGIEAARIIRETHPAMKIVMLTASDSDRDIFASLCVGASGYCLKDVSPDRLFTAIKSAYNGDIWLDASIAQKVIREYGLQPGINNKRVASLPDPLSPRELEVLNLLVNGASNQEIANTLVISLATAKTHVRSILNKLAVDDRTQAAVNAMRHGLV